MGIWNYLKLKNCDFESNRASGYAAALWLASVDPYSVQLTHKPVDIINWYIYCMCFCVLMLIGFKTFPFLVHLLVTFRLAML